jgi:hypothetical protein
MTVAYDSLSVRAVSSAGGDTTVAGNSVNFTIGQTVIDAYYGGGGILTNGFQQPEVEIIVSAINNISTNNVSLNIYPNPTDGVLNIATSMPFTSKTIAQIYDLQGKLVFTQELGKEVNINSFSIANFAAGLYILKIITEGDSNIRTFKIEKIN